MKLLVALLSFREQQTEKVTELNGLIYISGFWIWHQEEHIYRKQWALWKEGQGTTDYSGRDLQPTQDSW